MKYDALVAQLRTLKLTGMADALEQQLEQPATHDDLSFLERLSLLTDRETYSKEQHTGGTATQSCTTEDSGTA